MGESPQFTPTLCFFDVQWREDDDPNTKPRHRVAVFSQIHEAGTVYLSSLSTRSSLPSVCGESAGTLRAAAQSPFTCSDSSTSSAAPSLRPRPRCPRCAGGTSLGIGAVSSGTSRHGWCSVLVQGCGGHGCPGGTGRGARAPGRWLLFKPQPLFCSSPLCARRGFCCCLKSLNSCHICRGRGNAQQMPWAEGVGGGWGSPAPPCSRSLQGMVQRSRLREAPSCWGSAGPPLVLQVSL